MEAKPASTEAKAIPGRCSFFVERKHRFCKLESAVGRKYCAQHLIAEQGDSSSSKEGAPLRKRIPCPLDPKHSCYADKLKKHLKKCNAREKDLPDYHVKGINRIGAKDVEPQLQVTLSSLSRKELQQLIDSVNTIYKANPVDISNMILSHPVLGDELSKESNGPSAKKHLCQMASLIGQLQQANILGSDVCYVEFGAGRGHMSHWVQQAVAGQSNVSFLLVDRAHVRHKLDTIHRFQKDGPHYERIRIDIEHLCLGKVPCISSSTSPLAAYSKHLCGAATDLTLHCLMETLNAQQDTNTNNSSTTKTSRSQVNGIVIALCCHHRCDWSSYVGRDWWLAQGLTSKDFTAVSHMSSWATCGPGGGWTPKKTTNKNQKEETCEEEDIANSSLPKQQFEGDTACNKKEQNQGTDESRHKGSSVSLNVGTNKDMDNLSNTSTVASDRTSLSNQAQDVVGKLDIDEESSEHVARQLDAEILPRSKVSKVDRDSDVHSYGGDVSAQRLVGLGVLEREDIGRQCKRLIDLGRMAYLQDFGFKSQLVYYVDKELSLENVALVALPNKQL
ncbi:tRNA:m(4)X modification enzyme TRM13 homolog [Amphiura filiformis]|uniref:tRNA:m(4)X modification enzyme TRM13 homolog n=1 Tax=Amphiura filiformis TaxID=82378 RepID=UPI003B228BEA